MKFQDGFRAVFYFEKIQELKVSLETQMQLFKKLWKDFDCAKTVENICEQAAYQADQALLPVVVNEIKNERNKKKLIGKDSKQRCQYFFLRNKKWSLKSKTMPRDYPFVFEIISSIINSIYYNVSYAIQRFYEDYLDIIKLILNPYHGPLAGMKFGLSDRHNNGQQTIIFIFKSGDKIIYKPVDLTTNLLFEQFIKILELENPYDLKCLKIIARKDYGWIEYIYPKECESKGELKNYYLRAGTLLAIADSLNYCDGHLENLIASAGYPYLIDLETLFHVFGPIDPKLGERSVLFTGLIEKPPKNEFDKGYTSAFQAQCVKRYELLYPYALNDHTDEIEVHYRGYRNERTDNCPIFNNALQTPLHYIDEFVLGFTYGYNRITLLASSWINCIDWWERLKQCKCRQIIRHTLYYEFLIRKIQQPEYCRSKNKALKYIRPLLISDERYLKNLFAYEAEEILKADIPYFYHYPDSKELYDSCGNIYKNYFDQSSLNEIIMQIQNRSKEYLERNIQILKNVLSFSNDAILLS